MDLSNFMNKLTLVYMHADMMAAELEMEGRGNTNCSSSSFIPYLQQCYDCAKGMKNETAFANYIQQAMDECILGEAITASEVLTSTTSQTSVSATQTSTTQASTVRIAGSSQSSNSSPGGTTGSVQSSNSSPGAHSNTSTIVPAVVVPVVAVLAAALLFFFIKRRQRKRSITYPASPPPLEYKAQLHADDFRPELDGSSSASGERPKVVSEMLAEPVVNHMVELPAEEVAEEMGVNRENR